jgi:phenylalanyl-tRNA synthetase beta chain
MNIFDRLGFSPQIKTEDLVVCTPPSWRHDLHREADLIEEAARCYGYDKIPVEPKIQIEVAPPNLREKTAAQIRTFLNGAGFYESINISFVDADLAALFCQQKPQQHLSVSDVSQKNLNLLRQNLIGSLMSVMRSNYNVGNRPCRLFELADTFIPDANHEPGKLPDEHTRIGLAMDDDFRVMRGVIEGLVGDICINSMLECKPASLKWAAAAAEILLDGQLLGIVGSLNAEIAAQFDLDKQMITAAELDFDLLLSKAGLIPAAAPIARFPAIVRDLSLIVDEPVQWAQITSVVRSKAPAELEQVDFTGLYRGKPIPNGKKSITVSLRFRDDQGTLRHETVDEWQDGILAGLTESLGAELRTV